MLAAATYLHHACFLGLTAILATVLAIFLGRTVTCPMRALGTWFVSHDNNLLFGVVIVGAYSIWGLIQDYARPIVRLGQERMLRKQVLRVQALACFLSGKPT
jgi:uncharacterized protein (DUF2062 family)